MNIDDIDTPRFNMALDLFGEGHMLSFDGVDLFLESKEVLRAYVQSSWQIANMSEERAMRDFEDARRKLDYLMTSRRFSDLIGGRRTEMDLVDNYGTGTVGWARLVDDKVIWNDALTNDA